MLAFRRLIEFGALALSILAGLVALLLADEAPILIESRESKTIDGKPVFNRISWRRESTGDVWFMQQSHGGIDAIEWDRIEIALDKTEKTARYRQLESAPLATEHLHRTEPQIPSQAQSHPVPHQKLMAAFEGGERETHFKVSCFLCHPNGPRVVRPNWDSTSAPVSTWNKARLALWNLRIKSYGRVLPHEEHVDEWKARGTKDESQNVMPFRFPGPIENQKLEVVACTRCHRDEGLFARGALVRQNFLAIRFMVDSGLMPPMGLPLSPEDKAAIDRFTTGR